MYHARSLSEVPGGIQRGMPTHSPTRITKNSILKLAGPFHWPNTSRIRFWAFSYSVGEGKTLSAPSGSLCIRLATVLDSMGVVHEPVEDAVGPCGIADLRVPAESGRSGWSARRRTERTLITQRFHHVSSPRRGVGRPPACFFFGALAPMCFTNPPPRDDSIYSQPETRGWAS